MRLIDADALRAQFDDIPQFIGMTGGCVQQFIDKAPTIEAKPVVHGKWETHKIHGIRKGTVRRICSVCGSNNGNRKSPYCPNCGADMRERKDKDV